jgi:hypothetical protein
MPRAWLTASYNDLVTNYDLQLRCLGLRARPLRAYDSTSFGTSLTILPGIPSAGSERA